MTYETIQTQIIELKDFDLSKINQTFDAAEFERKISTNSVGKIVTALIENKMHNRVLRAYKNEEGMYTVLDGQHRLKALEICHRTYGLKTFDLTLELWPSGMGREVYLSINTARPVNSKDFTKALDDGSIGFFKEFSDILNHYRTKKQFSYYDALQGIQYVRTGVQSGLKSYEIKRFIESLTPNEKEAIRRTVVAIYTDGESIRTLPQAKTCVLRPLMKLNHDENLDAVITFNLSKRMLENDKIKGIIMADRGASREAARLIYEITLKEILPKFLK